MEYFQISWLRLAARWRGVVGAVFSDFVAAMGVWGVVVALFSEFVAEIGCEGVGSGGRSIF